MRKQPCLSMERLIHEALGKSPEECGAWAVGQIQAGIAIETLMAVGQFLVGKGERERAGGMLLSDIFQESAVVPDSIKEDDGSYIGNHLGPRQIFRSEYERTMQYIGLGTAS